MNTKGERREQQRRKRRHGMKVHGAGARLLARIVQDKAEEAKRATGASQ